MSTHMQWDLVRQCAEVVSEYVRANLVDHMNSEVANECETRGSAGGRHSRGNDELIPLSTHFTRWLRERLPSGLFDYLLQGPMTDGNGGDLVLSLDEIGSLQQAVEDLPPHGSPFDWESWPAPHGRVAQFLIRLAESVGPAGTSHWSKQLAGFQRLETEHAKLDAGLLRCQECLEALYTAARQAERRDLLPAPEGSVPTPTCPEPAVKKPKRKKDLADQLREAIAEHPEGRRAPRQGLYAMVPGRRIDKVRGLNDLYDRDEYDRKGRNQPPRPGDS